MMGKQLRIDSLPKYTPVLLNFGAVYEEEAIFLYASGTGDKRLAHFYTRTAKRESLAVNNRDGYEWEAYRFEGHWAYGSSAQRLRLIEIRGC